MTEQFSILRGHRNKLTMQLGATVMVVSLVGNTQFVSVASSKNLHVPRKNHISIEAVLAAMSTVDRALVKIKNAVTTSNKTNKGLVAHGNVFCVTQEGEKVSWSSNLNVSPCTTPTTNDKAPYVRIATLLERARAALEDLQHRHVHNKYPLPNDIHVFDNDIPRGNWRRVRGTIPRGRFPKNVVHSGTSGTSRVAALKNRIAFEKLALGKELGKGSFGVVHEATVDDNHRRYVDGLTRRVPHDPTLPPNGHLVAIKFQVIDDEADLKRAVRESAIQRKLHTAAAAPALYASGYDRENATYVTYMERVKGTTVADWLKNHRETLPLFLFKEIEIAVIRMWRHGFAHVDLNSNNIMIRERADSKGNSVVIIDYGLSVPLPRWLVPTTIAQAQSREYQQGLLHALDARYPALKMNRGAPDPHVLRWLFTFVPREPLLPRPPPTSSAGQSAWNN